MATKAWSIILMSLTTLLISFAQVLYKMGANNLTSFNIYSIITNYALIAGILVYGIAAVLMVIAFKGGEVSVLYPIIAFSYIWVSLMSITFFREPMNLFKWFGVCLIVLGVCVINYKVKIIKKGRKIK